MVYKKPMIPSENENTSDTIMIIAGEVSGDLIGASLIKELKVLDPGLIFCGIGGDSMKSMGMDLVYHINRMAFLGFTEILKHIPFIKNVQSELLEVIIKREIKKIVLIDYPGFNLNFAEKIKNSGIKIIYYVSPQLWAWGKGRMKKIKALVDKMLVVFPFEEKLYKDNKVDAEFIGHPLAERIAEYRFLSKEELYNKFNLDESKEILLLMPGSRKNEVEKIFPQMIKAAYMLAGRFDLQIVTACSSNIDETFFLDISREENYKIVRDHNFDLMKHAKIGIIKSGTSTLEAAYFSLPMVIVYKTSLLTYLIGKRLIKVKNIGMANIILEKNVVPEILQNDVRDTMIFDEAAKILSDNEYNNSIKRELSEVKNIIGNPGASARAAKIIYELKNAS